LQHFFEQTQPLKHRDSIVLNEVCANSLEAMPQIDAIDDGDAMTVTSQQNSRRTTG
jgi:hypothetical protein